MSMAAGAMDMLGIKAHWSDGTLKDGAAIAAELTVALSLQPAEMRGILVDVLMPGEYAKQAIVGTAASFLAALGDPPQ